MTALNLTPAQIEYLSMLCDIDDDPENAVSSGVSAETWQATRDAVFAASKRAAFGAVCETHGEGCSNPIASHALTVTVAHVAADDMPLVADWIATQIPRDFEFETGSVTVTS